MKLISFILGESAFFIEKIGYFPRTNVIALYYTSYIFHTEFSQIFEPNNYLNEFRFPLRNIVYDYDNLPISKSSYLYLKKVREIFSK